MKTYIKPEIENIEYNVVSSLMVNSLPLNDTPVNGDQALSRRHETWDVVDDDTDF